MKPRHAFVSSKLFAIFVIVLLSGVIAALAFSTEVLSFENVAPPRPGVIFASFGVGKDDKRRPSTDSKKTSEAELGNSDRIVIGNGTGAITDLDRFDKVQMILPNGMTQDLATIKDFEPAWSPDGRKIAFISVRNHPQYDSSGFIQDHRRLFTMNADGTDQRLVYGPLIGPQTEPSFSPDGQKIVFVAQYSGQEPGIYTTNVDGSGHTRVDTSACMANPEFYSSSKTRAARRSEPGFLGYDTPNFSPDGQYIIFGKQEVGIIGAMAVGNHVYRVRTDGTGGCTIMYEPPPSSSSPPTGARYSPDGTKISLYRVEGYGETAERILTIINATTGALIEEHTPTEFFGNAVWSPDGTSVAYPTGYFDNKMDEDIVGWRVRSYDLDTLMSTVVLDTMNPQGVRGLSYGTPAAVGPALSMRINSPNPVTSGLSTTGTLYLRTPAPAGGRTVSLVALGALNAITVPASVHIEEGQTQANFPINTEVNNLYRSADVSAFSGPDRAQATVSLAPAKPDLRAVSVTGPASTAPGVSFNVSWVVENIGTGATPSDGGVDRLYFSPDNILGNGGDPMIRSVANASPLTPGQSRTVNTTATIPTNAVPSSGQFYLFLVTNEFEQIDENGETANNVTSTTIRVNLPDLVAENLVVPANVEPNVPYTLTWTTRNAGTASAGTSNTRIFFSNDDIAGNSDDTQLQQISTPVLAAGQSINESRSATIPTLPVRPSGTAFFYVRVDASNQIYEGPPSGPGETNNTIFASTQFEYRVPDLQVTAASTAPEVESDTSFPIEWTTTNAGNKAAPGFSDRVYFSTDNIVNANDVQLGTFALTGGLAEGASANRIQNVTIPTSAVSATGNYFVYVQTDVTGAVNEGPNESNNVRFHPVRVRRFQRPDLVVTNVTAPPTAFFDQTIQVQWTVRNNGPGATNTPQWRDRVVIGTSATSTSGATYLADPISLTALNVNDSYTASATVRIPRGIQGAYHIHVITDSNNNVNEENNNNNGLSRPIQITVPPLPDLTVETVQAPDESFAGAEITINYTIRNQGTEDSGGRRDRIYFSRDTTLNTGQDRLVFTSDILYGPNAGQSVNHIARNYNTGSNPATYRLARVPSDMEGLWYVFVVADYANDIYEYTAENNNSGRDTTEPGSPINIIATPPDLVISSAPTAPTTASSGQSLAVSFTVTNQGAFAAAFNLRHALYLSADQAIGTGDILLATSVDPNSFPPGGSHLIETSVSLPNCLPNGTYYLIALADSTNQQFEFDPGFDAEANNASPAHTLTINTLPPDLQVTNLQIPATGITPGSSVPISFTVANVGAGPTLQRRWYDVVTLRSTNPQVPAQQLASIERNLNLASGGSYVENRSVQMPAYMQGDYFITVATDPQNYVPECGSADTNNTATSSTFSVANNLPDLVIDSVTAPSSAVVGASFNVQWIGRNANQPMPPNSSSWNDSIYLSSNEAFDNSDRYLGQAVSNTILAGGQTYGKDQVVTTGNISPGNYYILVVGDRGNNIYEGTGGSTPESNNVRASGQITLTSPGIDLVASNVIVQPPYYSGTAVRFTWTVTNSGTSPTLRPDWYDYVILSRDSILDPSDTTLGYSQHNGTLAGGASYNQSTYFNIPNGLTGDYTVFVIADRSNYVIESNDNNNTAPPVTFNLTLPPPAEMSVSNVTPPATINLGESAVFNWTVVNNGANAVNGQWRDTVYLSRDTLWDASDTLVGIRDFNSTQTPVPAAGGSYAGATSYIGPPVEEGAYYVIVRTDAQNRIRESNEVNNLSISATTTNVTITQLTLGTPFSSTLAEGAQKFFKFNTPELETLLVSLNTNTPNRANELFTNYDTIVSRADYDFQGQRPGEGNQTNFIPESQAGDYYSLVRHDAIPGSFAENFNAAPEKSKAKVENDGQLPPQNITVKAEILPFTVRSVSPERAGNAGLASMIVEGAKFQSGATLKLVGSGGLQISPSQFRVYPTSIAAIFDLKDKPAGVYDVVVRNPNNDTSTLEDGFTIVSGGGASEPRVGINAPNQSRGGRMRYTFSFSNDGLNDLYFVPLIITLPSHVPYELDESNYLTNEELAEFMPPDAIPSQLPREYVHDGVRIIPLFTPVLGSGRTVNVRIDVTLPFGFSPVEVTAMALPSITEWWDLARDQQENLLRRKMATAGLGAEDPCLDRFKNCLRNMLVSLILTAIQEILPTDCVGAIMKGFVTATDTALGMWLKGGPGGAWDKIGSLTAMMTGVLVGVGTDCIDDAVPWFKYVDIALFSLAGLANLYDCIQSYRECVPPPETHQLSFLTSIDPNEKIGPNGYGAEKFVPIKQPLLFRINFENLSSASAPAQLVRITDNLPPPLDIRTVRLKEIGFKQNRIVVPDNQAFYQRRIQLGADLNNLEADILAGVDLVNNRVFWSLQAIDPQTSEAPLDPLAGLLPPNNANRDGEGYVLFTVEAKPTFPNRTEIINSATIVFDQNEPIVTNQTMNLLDSVVPMTQIAALPPTSVTPEVYLNWTASDDTDGSGFLGTNLLVSEDGSAYGAFANTAPGSSASFIGRWGKSYRFYSIGRDNAGNIELPPTLPDATIRILGGDTEGDLAPRPNGNDGLLDGSDADQVRRFVAGLDTNFQYNEFQRADGAPRVGGGNGALTVADIMQTRRYIAGTDAKAEAGGPNEATALAPTAIAGKRAANAPPRSITAARIQRIANKIHITIDLEAQGDETGVGFTLGFDPTVLSNPTEIQAGPDATASAITVNTSQVATGRLGIIVDKAPNSPIPAGLRSIVTLAFDIAPGTPMFTTISFEPAPIAGEVVNGNADVLNTIFTNANISLAPPTSAPVSISGRVLANGRGVFPGLVDLTDTEGRTRTVRTGSFGNYWFDDVEPGRTYIIRPRSKQYLFQPRVVIVSEQIVGLDLIADP